MIWYYPPVLYFIVGFASATFMGRKGWLADVNHGQKLSLWFFFWAMLAWPFCWLYGVGLLFSRLIQKVAHP